MKKHIVCFGDSNTHGYCTDPTDCADHGDRFNEDERWTCLLQKMLGEEYLILEEGLSGRTTVFNDPLYEGLSALDVISPILMSHEPVDLLIIMLGTNDTKDRFSASAACIALGLTRLITKAKEIPCWGSNAPNILILCPPPIGDEMVQSAVGSTMGTGCPAKSRALHEQYRLVAENQGCAYLNAADFAVFNAVDYMHLTRSSHQTIAQKLFEQIPVLL